MRFAWTEDWVLIREVMTHERLFDWLTDDTATRETFAVPRHMSYAAVWDRTEFLGLFAVSPLNCVSAEIHTMLLPNAWGRSTAIYTQGIEWLFRNTRLKKIIGNIRASNALAIRAAERAGLARIGVNERCVRKHGRLQDQIIYGLCAPEQDN